MHKDILQHVTPKELELIAVFYGFVAVCLTAYYIYLAFQRRRDKNNRQKKPSTQTHGRSKRRRKRLK